MRLVERAGTHSWKVLTVVSAIVGFFGILDIAGGASDLAGGETVLMHGLTGTGWDELRRADPAAAHLVDWKFRSGGATLVALGTLSTVVSVAALRRGERWAWYAMWTMPAWMVGTAVSVAVAVDHPGFGTPVPVISGSFLGFVSAAALAAAHPVCFRAEGRAVEARDRAPA